MSYPFIQGIDYGPRKGTLGWNIHMTEGGDGTAEWLRQKAGETRTQWAERVNGVSCHFVVQSTGRIIQMVAWDRAAGNLNPRDRSTDKAFYGRRFLLAVLGDKWTDPNAYTCSIEMSGFRAKGPTRAQVEAVVQLVAEGRERFPTMRGAFGHADQTDTKGCPGTSPLMLELWERIGHGLFTEEEVVKSFAVYEDRAYVTVKGGAWLYDNAALHPSPSNVQLADDRELVYVGTYSPDVRIIAYEGAAPDADGSSRAMFAKVADVVLPPRFEKAADCGPAVTKAIETFRTAVAASVGKAIDTTPGSAA